MIFCTDAYGRHFPIDVVNNIVRLWKEKAIGLFIFEWFTR